VKFVREILIGSKKRKNAKKEGTLRLGVFLSVIWFDEIFTIKFIVIVHRVSRLNVLA